MPRSSEFPPPPRALHARSRELATLVAAVRSGLVDDGAPRPAARLALVGGGGSGKSTLACALGHRVKRLFPGGIEWFRVGAWDVLTLTGMLALRFGVPLTPRARALGGVRAHLAARGPTLVVLDNHEDDRAVAALLDGLRDAPVTWVITARRCLLAGVSVFPVVPPLVTVGRSPFPRVASLTRLLRWNPVALNLADAIVAAGATSAADLGARLLAGGVGRVRVIAHEDNLPEVGLLVDVAWKLLPAPSRRMLAVLAHTGGDHVDAASLASLARVGARGRGQPSPRSPASAWCRSPSPAASRSTPPCATPWRSAPTGTRPPTSSTPSRCWRATPSASSWSRRTSSPPWTSPTPPAASAPRCAWSGCSRAWRPAEAPCLPRAWRPAEAPCLPEPRPEGRGMSVESRPESPAAPGYRRDKT